MFTRRSLPEVLEKQANMLISGAKGYKGLYQEARSHAPEVKSEIKGLPTKLGWRIKRKGGSVKKEIRRRLKYAGLVQSTGWFNNRYGTPRKDGTAVIRQVSNPRGRVITRLTGNNPYIILINRTPNAGEYAKKTGYIDAAIRGRADDMMEYVKKHIFSQAQKFFNLK